MDPKFCQRKLAFLTRPLNVPLADAALKGTALGLTLSFVALGLHTARGSLPLINSTVRRDGWEG